MSDLEAVNHETDRVFRSLARSQAQRAHTYELRHAPSLSERSQRARALDKANAKFAGVGLAATSHAAARDLLLQRAGVPVKLL